MLEPLVDTVNPDQINTSIFPILKLDIATVKKEDLDFKSKFTLTATRNDYIHALIGYFDITFTGHKTIFFSTGPQHKYTHWKQTVFYLDDVLPVRKGDTITGELACKRNDKNPRDLDITIAYDFKGEHQHYKHSQFYRLR
eukprot:GEZU01013706.1.p2 GENE.GEZU01013706.1~~GEZU01013706.1.p2  ORF type:complete len:140 (-),score=49.81 GEZU01013706.1:215-634(-)